MQSELDATTASRKVRRKPRPAPLTRQVLWDPDVRRIHFLEHRLNSTGKLPAVFHLQAVEVLIERQAPFQTDVNIVVSIVCANELIIWPP